MTYRLLLFCNPIQTKSPLKLQIALYFRVLCSEEFCKSFRVVYTYFESLFSRYGGDFLIVVIEPMLAVSNGVNVITALPLSSPVFPCFPLSYPFYPAQVERSSER